MQRKHLVGLACLFLLGLGCDATPVTGPLPTIDQIDPNPPRSPGAPGAPSTPAAGGGDQAAAAPKKPEFDFGTTDPVFKKDNVYLAGQPSEADLKKIADHGITQVISLCTDGEINWDEKAAVEEAGMVYHNIPISSPEDLTEETLESVRELLKNAGEEQVLLHCKSAVRAKAVWIPFRAMDQGKGVRGAVTELKDMRHLPEVWLGPSALYATNKLKEGKSEEK